MSAKKVCATHIFCNLSEKAFQYSDKFQAQSEGNKQILKADTIDFHN